jgi:hypothetical protein
MVVVQGVQEPADRCHRLWHRQHRDSAFFSEQGWIFIKKLVDVD